MCFVDVDFISIHRKLEQDFPGIRVVGYCYDWEGRDPPCSPGGRGFYMRFEFKEEHPSKKAWKSFHKLVQTIKEYDLVDDNEETVFDLIEVVLNDDSGIMFIMHGYAGDLFVNYEDAP
jgi:hypothetical protein